MEEKNKVVSIRAAKTNAARIKAARTMTVLIWVSVIFGGIILVMTVIAIIQGINLSDCEIARAESLNRAYAGEYNLCPSEGVDYKLEARVVGKNSENPWHHDVIVADYGDTIEVRLKAVAADAADADSDTIRHRMRFACSSGLELLETAADHTQVVLPDGSFADYLEEFGNEHVTYVAVGTFKFTSRDWWSGRSASTIIPCNADMFTKLEVIAPYCDVDILVIIAFVAATVLFSIVIPIIFKREADCILEEREETEDAE